MASASSVAATTSCDKPSRADGLAGVVSRGVISWYFAAGAAFGTRLAIPGGVKTVLIFVLAGALLGVVAASYIVPPALSWYSAPGGLPEGAQVQAVVQIPEVIRYATTKLMRGQLIGAGIGGVFGLVVGILMVGKRKVVVPPPAHLPA
jgi:hypothetical protein